jgi:hypothetical protein
MLGWVRLDKYIYWKHWANDFNHAIAHVPDELGRHPHCQNVGLDFKFLPLNAGENDE